MILIVMSNYCRFICVKSINYQLRRFERLKVFSRCISFNYNGTGLNYETFKRPQSFPLLIQIRMAGHSKWQNIRHIKAAKDLEKSKIASRIALQVKKAVLESGPNPRYNSKLQQLLDEAKENNVPKATVDKAISKAQNAKITTATFEILGPGGSFFIVEVETDNVNIALHDIRVICRKNGVATVPEGRVKSQFEIKGVITVSSTNDNSPLDHAKAVDLAIEAGAEDVQECTDENQKKTLKFISDAGSFYQVKKHIDSSKYVIDSANIEYIPRIRVTLNEELLEAAGNLCNMLEELPEVVNIYDNIE